MFIEQVMQGTKGEEKSYYRKCFWEYHHPCVDEKKKKKSDITSPNRKTHHLQNTEREPESPDPTTNWRRLPLHSHRLSAIQTDNTSSGEDADGWACHTRLVAMSKGLTALGNSLQSLRSYLMPLPMSQQFPPQASPQEKCKHRLTQTCTGCSEQLCNSPKLGTSQTSIRVERIEHVAVYPHNAILLSSKEGSAIDTQYEWVWK